MCPKIHTEKKEYESPEEVQALKILISTGDSYFKIQSLKVGINRQPPMHLDNSHTIEIEADGLLIRMSNEIKPVLLKMLMDTLKESLC